MGPTIILDKSCIQSLSAHELDFLYRYYTLNIPPVLISEIIGDLMKPNKTGAITGEEVVRLSNKLFQMNSAVSAHYRIMVISSLMGQQIKMDGRPHVHGKPVQDPDGKRGYLMEESLEEKAIHRWRSGRFSEAETLLAGRWRESTRQMDLTRFKDMYQKLSSLVPQTDTFASLVREIDPILLNPSQKIQTQLLSTLLYEFQIHPNPASIIFHRWEQGSFSLVSEFAPYAFYCFRVTLSFYIGLVRNFISPRPTNRIDLEYVYYLPFSLVFSSRDNFHMNFIPTFLREDQSLVPGDTLKQDLRSIADQWDSLDAQQQSSWLKKNGNYPPAQNESITFRLWQKYTESREPIDRAVSSPGESKNRASNLMERFDGLKPINDFSEDDESNIDFIVRSRTISAQDPCPCGSGKKFKECCFSKATKS